MYIQFWSLEKFLYKNKPFRRFFRFFFLFPRLGSVKNRKPAVKEILHLFWLAETRSNWREFACRAAAYPSKSADCRRWTKGRFCRTLSHAQAANQSLQKARSACSSRQISCGTNSWPAWTSPTNTRVFVLWGYARRWVCPDLVGLCLSLCSPTVDLCGSRLSRAPHLAAALFYFFFY